MVSISKPLPKFFPRIYESQLNDKILFIKVKRPIFRKKMTFVRGKSFYKKECDITSMQRLHLLIKYAIDLRVGADILSPHLPKLANIERGKKTGDKH